MNVWKISGKLVRVFRNRHGNWVTKEEVTKTYVEAGSKDEAELKGLNLGFFPLNVTFFCKGRSRVCS